MSKDSPFKVLNELEQKMSEIVSDKADHVSLKSFDIDEIIMKAVENPEDYSSRDLERVLNDWRAHKKEEKAKRKTLRKLKRIINMQYSVHWSTNLKVFAKNIKRKK